MIKALQSMFNAAMGSTARYVVQTNHMPRKRQGYPGYCAGEKEKARRLRQVAAYQLEMAGVKETREARMTALGRAA
jgi:hypothetical protein